MPNITDLTEQITFFPNLFISPFGNDGASPLYSSIPINLGNGTQCMPCSACGNATERQRLIANASTRLQTPLYDSTDIAITP